MEKAIRDKIVNHQVHNVDKFYRMFSGLSSMLDDYADSTIYLTIHKNSKWKKDNPTTARQLANSWRNFNDELKDAEKYQVTIIHDETLTGFAMSIEGLSESTVRKKIEKFMKLTPQNASENSKSESLVYTGYFDDPE